MATARQTPPVPEIYNRWLQLEPGVLALPLLSPCLPPESTPLWGCRLGLCWDGQSYHTWTPLLSRGWHGPKLLGVRLPALPTPPLPASAFAHYQGPKTQDT